MAEGDGQATDSAIFDCRRLRLGIPSLQHGIPKSPNLRHVLSRGKQRAGREGFGTPVGGMSAKDQIWAQRKAKVRMSPMLCITSFLIELLLTLQ